MYIILNVSGTEWAKANARVSERARIVIRKRASIQKGAQRNACRIYIPWKRHCVPFQWIFQFVCVRHIKLYRCVSQYNVDCGLLINFIQHLFFHHHLYFLPSLPPLLLFHFLCHFSLGLQNMQRIWFKLHCELLFPLYAVTSTWIACSIPSICGISRIPLPAYPLCVTSAFF